MADRDPGQDSLLREIDEDLRHERFAKLWKQYGGYLIGLVVLLVVGVAGYQFWQSYDADRRAEQSALLTNALRAVDEEKRDDADALLSALAEQGSGGYATLARLNHAAVQARAGDEKAAASSYLAIARDDSIDPELRDLALLLSVLHEMNTGAAQDLTDRLEPLIAASSPWRHVAKELTASLARRMGDTQRAAQLFRELADDATAPSGVRARAAEMSAILES